ncbi:hypothetical protein HYU14_00600 [Candidatus Woesearchaeota archaeon]|nr:hypothetical protein [Candidatus Woesearchaeota archaeon]
MSMKRVDALRDVLEQACRKHWAYEVTSTLPWWVNRGRYSLGELKGMAGELAKSCPPEPEVPHLEKALVKANSIISEATGKNYGIRSFEDLRGAARTL